MHKTRRGFTLIELLVVMTIIAVIAMAAFANFASASRSARDGRRKADLEVVRQALVLSKSENGTYIANAGNNNAAYNTVAATLETDGFLSNPTPVDPRNGATYFYTYTGTAATFCACAKVENTNNGNSSAAGSCDSLGSSGAYYCVRHP